MSRQQATVQLETEIVQLSTESAPIDQVLDRLRSIEDLAVYGQASEYTLNQIAKLSAAAICAAREIKKH